MELTDKQLDIIIGSLIGDGCITNCRRPDGRKRNGHFEIKQKASRSEYLDGLRSSLSPFSKEVKYGQGKKPIKKDGKVIHSDCEFLTYCRLRTCASEEFTKIHSQWYINDGKRFSKIVPANLKLNWDRIAIWLCDDGGVRHNKKEITFATNGFDKNSRQILIKEMLRLGIETTEWKDKRMYVKTKHYEFMMSKLTPRIPWKCFAYKVRGFNATA
jgi:hypothetical protein